MSTRRVMMSLMGAATLLALLLMWGLWDAMGPDGPSDAAIAARARRPAETAPQARPFAARRPINGDCAVDVHVRDPDGAPLAGVDVGVGAVAAGDTGAPSTPDAVQWEPAAERTDRDGDARLSGLPCEVLQVWAGFGAETRARVSIPVLPEARSAVELVLSPSGMVRVTVEDIHGTPAAGAHIVAVGADGETPVTGVVLDEQPGSWLVAIPTDAPITVQASLFESGPMAHGWYETEDTVEIATDELVGAPADGVLRELALVLDVDRVVQVRCLGMPDDSCAGVEPIQCTEPLLPLGMACPGGVVASCICPPGRAAVRGGGASVAVPPGATEVWLDLGFGGAITGRAVEDGEPTACTATVVRLPEGLEDLPRGGLLGRESRCDADGRFRLDGLVKGDWHVEVRHGPRTVRLPPVRINGEATDVGDVELWGGGSIEGVVEDGLTGEPIGHAPVVALRTVGPDERSTPAFGDTDAEGRFTIEGLPPGPWEVFTMTSPFRRTRVTVEDGLVTDGVRVRTAEATLLDDNGIALHSGKDGALRVESVDPDGAAAERGLRAGDAVVGVTLLGFDSTTLPAEFSEKMAEGLLGHWGGPGIGLVIERDGVLMDVELD